MKLTRSEFQNYIHSYETDEIFYRDLYFAEKEHPETFMEYCQGLDRELITSHRLYVPAFARRPGFHTWKKATCSGILMEILCCASITVILRSMYTSMSSLRSFVFMMELRTRRFREFPILCIREISVLFRLTPNIV